MEPEPVVFEDKMSSPSKRVLNQNQSKEQIFEKMMDDLIDIFKTTASEHPDEASAFDRIIHFLKFTKDVNPKSDREKGWIRRDHSGCCKIDETVDTTSLTYDSLPENNYLDQIHEKLDIYEKLLKNFSKDKKMEFMQFYEIHSNLMKFKKSVELTMVEHMGDRRFPMYVEQGNMVLESIRYLEIELEEKIEPSVEQKKEVKEEAKEKVQKEVEKEIELEKEVEVKKEMKVEEEMEVEKEMEVKKEMKVEEKMEVEEEMEVEKKMEVMEEFEMKKDEANK